MGLHRALVVAAVAASGSFFASGATAAPVTLSYEAPQGCPVTSGFVEAVAKRGRTIAVPKDGESPALRVSIGKSAKGYRGVLAFGGGETREVEAATCADVVSALAIVTVSAIGPDESSGPTEASTADPAPVAAPASPPVSTTATSSPTVVNPATPSVVTHAPSSHVPELPSDLTVPAGKLEARRDVVLKAQAGFAWGLLPSVTMPRYDLLVSVANFLAPADGRLFRVGALVRVRATLFGEGRLVSSHGTTRGEGFAVGLDVCTPLHYDPAGFIASFCPTFSGGQLLLRTSNAEQIETQRKVTGFGTAGIGLQLDYNLARHFHLGLELGGDVILGDRTAEVPDGRPLFASTRWTLHGAFALGTTF